MKVKDSRRKSSREERQKHERRHLARHRVAGVLVVQPGVERRQIRQPRRCLAPRSQRGLRKQKRCSSRAG
jgi:hypothetical protein